MARAPLPQILHRKPGLMQHRLRMQKNEVWIGMLPIQMADQDVEFFLDESKWHCRPSLGIGLN